MHGSHGCTPVFSLTSSHVVFHQVASRATQLYFTVTDMQKIVNTPSHSKNIFKTSITCSTDPVFPTLGKHYRLLCILCNFLLKEPYSSYFMSVLFHASLAFYY